MSIDLQVRTVLDLRFQYLGAEQSRHFRTTIDPAEKFEINLPAPETSILAWLARFPLGIWAAIIDFVSSRYISRTAADLKTTVGVD